MWGFCEHTGTTLPLQLDPPNPCLAPCSHRRKPRETPESSPQTKEKNNEKNELSALMVPNILPCAAKNSLLEPCYCFLRTTGRSSI